MVLFLAMGSNFQATYRTLSTKIDVTKVLDHEKSNGGVHFAIEGDLDAVGDPRVPVQVPQTLQTIEYFTEVVS